MNGKAAKRIRHAARCSHRDVKELKREYKARPYHRRAHPMWQSHSVIICAMHRIYGLGYYAPDPSPTIRLR